MYLDEEIILLDQHADSMKDILLTVSEKFQMKGIVTDRFYEELILREELYPTGLPTTPFGIAIPHTDVEFVNKSQIGFVSLKEPVLFNIMGGEKEDKTEVSLIFVLAFSTVDGQIDVLQKLITMFQNQKIVKALKNCRSVAEFKEIMNIEGVN